jgi:molybdopterin converting factor small subunit
MKESPLVTVEFYGIPRQRAGCAEIAVPAATVGELLTGVMQQCPGLNNLVRADGRLSPHYLLSVNGTRFVHAPQHPLQPGDQVLLLSADAGG